MVVAIKMISDPQTVEMRGHFGQNVFALILNNGLIVTPLVADHRG